MKSPLRILHLEDNDLDRELVRATLEADGLSGLWTYAKSRDEFWTAVQAGNIDLILADYALPAFNGLAALSLAQAACPEVPFIFISGELGEERAIESLKQGATDYVIKRRMTRLAPAVRRALREQAERDARQQADAALHKSEERYRSLVAATSSLVWTTDAKGCMSVREPGWETYTGQRWPDYAGWGWLDMIHPDDREAIKDRWTQSVAARSLHSGDGRLWHSASCSYHHYVSRGVPILDAAGQVREWVGTITDIHEHKLAQKAAQEAAEQQTRSQSLIAELSQVLTPSEVVEIIINYGIEVLGAIMGVVRLLTKDGLALEIVQSQGYPEDELTNWRLIPLSVPSLAGEAAQTREAIWIESQEAYLARNANVKQARPRLGHEAIVAMPLIFEDRVLGTLGFSFATQKVFSQAERDLMLTLARQCAQALERARLFESEQQARAEAQALNKELEARVQERTAQLEAALRELQSVNDELQNAIAARRQGEERFQWLVGVIDYGIIMLDPDGHIAGWNIGAERIYGYAEAEIIGQHFSRFYPPENIAWDKPAYELRKAAAEGRVEDEGWRVRKDGSRFWVNVIVTALRNKAGDLIGFGKVTRDLTLRKQMEEELRASREQLRQLSGYLQTAREEERTRISREIHDQLGGSLTALKMDLRQLQKGLDEGLSNPTRRLALVERINAMAQLIDEAAQTIRRIAADLRPGVLDDLGLEAAIEWQLQDFQTRSGIHCKMVASDVSALNLDRDGSTALFRVFQETLTNVARHAQATHVEVNLASQTDHLILQVRDNGRGISDEDMLGSRSLGLVGMRERIWSLNGELNIRGKPGEGTTVLARIPLPPNGPTQPGFE